ncbi:universal stress protein [Streptomyces tauricus]|uniref:universal stress protein n=1 Tax=Streptomyces tauricus TaxID=68274 RepID=UPI00387F005B
MAHPIVVGIDPDRSNRAAVAWASGEAGRRGLPLRLVVALERTCTQLPPDHSRPGRHPGSHACGGQAERVLREEVLWLYTRHPELDISTLVVPDAPMPVLRRQARTAEVLVLGSRHPRAPRERFKRTSVTFSLITQAACPVVVVREESDAVRQHPSFIVAGVNIGWDGRRHSEAAIDHAFEEAVRHQARLRLVHVWHPPLLGVLDEHATLRECHRLLSETVTRRREAFPDVEVQQAVLRGRPARVLARESALAIELVLGTRGHGMSPARRLDSVVHRALQSVVCPVVVIPRPGGPRLPHERPHVSRLTHLTGRSLSHYTRRLRVLARARPRKPLLGALHSMARGFERSWSTTLPRTSHATSAPTRALSAWLLRRRLVLSVIAQGMLARAAVCSKALLW